MQKKTIIEDFKQNARGQIKKFNEQTKTMILDMLQANSKDIPEDIVIDALGIVANYVSKFNIDKKIEKELNLLATKLDEKINFLENEKIPLIHIKCNEHGIPMDIIQKKTPKKFTVDVKSGRNGKYFNIESGSSTVIQDETLQYVTLNNNFTIDFWIKIPNPKNYDQILNANNRSIALIKNGLKHKDGWGITLSGRDLLFIIHTINKDDIILSHPNIANNTWTKVTIVNNATLKNIRLFINGVPVINRNYLIIPKASMVNKLNRRINIGLPIKQNFFYGIDDFKVYNTALHVENIEDRYIKDHNQDLLYDYFGDYIKKNKKYYLHAYDSSHCFISREDYRAYAGKGNVSRNASDVRISLYLNKSLQTPNKQETTTINNKDVVTVGAFSKGALGIFKIEKAINKSITINNTKFNSEVNDISYSVDRCLVYEKFKIFSLRSYFSELKHNYKAISFISSKNNMMSGLVLVDSTGIKSIEKLVNRNNIASEVISLSSNITGFSTMPQEVNCALFYLVPAED